MMYSIQIKNPIEQAKQALKNHADKGTQSHLSIFEVAKLMDTVVFGKNHEENSAYQFQLFAN